MNKKWLKKGFFLAVYLCLVIGFFFIGGDQLRHKTINSSMPQPNTILGELTSDIVIEQSFHSNVEIIDKLKLFSATFNRENKGQIMMSLYDSSNNVMVAKTTVNAADLTDNAEYIWELDAPVEDALKKDFLIVIESNCLSGSAPTFYYNNSSNETNSMKINGTFVSGTLSFSYEGRISLAFGNYYWQIVTFITLILLFYILWMIHRQKIGQPTLVVLMLNIWHKYDFLIKQLVVRDFKTKYKRSVLGYLWSFLNPLLTMAVQYIVFSTIFKSDIKNFPVYLLTGIILFNFFTEAVGQGLGAIVGNASLITKVYVPKYIYPITKVVSCSINLIISILPLLIVTIITGAKITPAIVLLPFALLNLLVFCIGMSLMLSAAMVFFRDTQYLWGIISLVWMYATPLFYPESIIPDKFMVILKVNPMYYIVNFARTILINGISPEPKLYFYCLFSSMTMLFIGSLVFKKTQDKFVLFI